MSISMTGECDRGDRVSDDIAGSDSIAANAERSSECRKRAKKEMLRSFPPRILPGGSPVGRATRLNRLVRPPTVFECPQRCRG